MSEIKKDNAQEAVKQLGQYKVGQFAQLKNFVAEQKSRVAALMATAVVRRDALALKEDEERKAREAEEETVVRTSKPPVVEQQPAAIEKPTEEVAAPAQPAVVAEPEPEKGKEPEQPVIAEEVKPAPEPAPEKAEKPAPAAPKAEEKAAPAKPAAPVRQATSNPAIQSEILPNGEIRRIYIPPTPVKKGVTTRVFEGGYNSGRGPRPQGTGAPRPQGGSFPRRDGLSASGLAEAARNAPPTKPAQKGGKQGSQKSGGQRDGDRGTMNKRALLKRGFIVDDKYGNMGDEGARVRVYKGGKNKNSAGGSVSFVEHAVITSDPVPIKVLSEKTGIGASEIISNLFKLGIIKTINESIDFETAELIVGEITKNNPITLELKAETTFEEALSAKLVIDDEDVTKLVPRPPVVTIMGHVDHGKTSLLDYIRKANVAGGEAGGITQHIGAYTISLKGSPITFLDTPGHEAFTSMRARGAQVTDIAVLVVAADDGIMPQTIEAINHARQAEVPIIVAVNKIDKTGANPDQVLHQLTEQGVLPEEWGGETPVVRVSAKTGEGVESLLENILIMAEMRELKANPDRPARGTIIEARLDKGIGKVATILVQTGTLRIGDNVVAGISTGKIRAMIDDKGKQVRKAGPSTPVSVTGWDEVPEAGDIIDVVADEKFARELAEERKLRLATKGDDSGSVSLNDLFDKIKKGELKSVKLIIKADVQGSLEAVKQSLSKLGNDEVDIDIVHGAVGAIKESDVNLADTAKAIIIGFNVRPDANAKILAAQKKIDIRYYEIIYNAIEDIEKAVKGMLEPKFKEVVLGTAEIRELFRISGVGVIAGCHVTDGKIVRGAQARLIRNGAVEITSEIASLRHGKDDVKEIAKNFDCGIMLQNYQDVKVGDIIEAFRMEKLDED